MHLLLMDMLALSQPSGAFSFLIFDGEASVKPWKYLEHESSNLSDPVRHGRHSGVSVHDGYSQIDDSSDE